MKWIKFKDEKPPLFEFVEVIFPDDSRLTENNRDFAVYMKDNDGFFWNSHMDERDWCHKEGFGIKYWRPMEPDHLGRKYYIKIRKNGFFEVYRKKDKKI